MSGHRSCESVTEPRPSVMEFPRIATAAAEFGVQTSIVLMAYQCDIVSITLKAAAVSCLPVTRYEVVRDPGCPVTVEEVWPKYMVIATFILGVRLNAIGSEITDVSAFMVTDALPLNFNCFKVDALMVLLPVETAIVAEFIVQAPVLKLLENLTRRVSPPIETQTTCRKVLLVKPGEGGILLDSTSCGPVLQVPTHFFAMAAWAEMFHELNARHDATNTGNERCKDPKPLNRHNERIPRSSASGSFNGTSQEAFGLVCIANITPPNVNLRNVEPGSTP